MNVRNYLNKEGLTHYDEKIKEWVDKDYLKKGELTDFQEQLDSLEEQFNSKTTPGEYEIIYTTTDDKKIEIIDSEEDQDYPYGQYQGNGDPFDGVLEHVVMNEYYPSKGYGIVKLKSNYIVHHLFWNQPTLKSIRVSGTFKTSGYLAFGYCPNLETAFFMDGFESFDGPDVKTHEYEDWGQTFSECHSLTSVAVPDSVKKLCAQMFINCKSLASFKIPQNVTELPMGLFWNSGLNYIYMPNGIKELPNQTFVGCENLISIKLPDALTSIGNQCFRDCRSLTNIDLFNNPVSTIYGSSSNITNLGIGVFRNCPSIRHLRIPASVTAVSPVYAFMYNLEELIIEGENVRFVETDTLLKYYSARSPHVRYIDSTSKYIQGFPIASKLETLILRYEGGVINDVETYLSTRVDETSEVNAPIFAKLDAKYNDPNYNPEYDTMPLVGSLSDNLETYIETPNTYLKIYVPTKLLEGYREAYPNLAKQIYPIQGEDEYHDMDSMTESEVEEMFNNIYK